MERRDRERRIEENTKEGDNKKRREGKGEDQERGAKGREGGKRCTRGRGRREGE